MSPITYWGIPIDSWAKAGTELIYLATPYNHPDPEVRADRFRTACRIAAALMREGVLLFCPIAHTHQIAEEGKLPKGWDYWRAYDRKMLSGCAELWIAKMDGWEESEGIKGEIEIAKELRLPIIRFDPRDILGPEA